MKWISYYNTINVFLTQMPVSMDPRQISHSQKFYCPVYYTCNFSQSNAFFFFLVHYTLTFSWMSHSNQNVLMKIKVCTCVYQERANTVLLRLLSLGKIEGKRKRRGQRMRCLNSITDSMDMNLGKLWEMVRDRWPGVLLSMGQQRVRHDLATEQQQQQSKELWKVNTVIFY